jgi:hypothetical protein
MEGLEQSWAARGYTSICVSQMTPDTWTCHQPKDSKSPTRKERQLYARRHPGNFLEGQNQEARSGRW